ncbi:MAG: hypothetical protein ACT4NV_14575 [Rhodoferax sp.]
MPFPPSTMSRWPQLLLIFIAGVASFLAANFWASQEETQTVDMVRSRPLPSIGADATKVEERPANAEPRHTSAAQTGVPHLAMVTLRNPFGPLNLQASTDTPAAKQAPSGEHRQHRPPLSPTPIPNVALAQAPLPIAAPTSPPPPTAPPLPFVAIGSIQGASITGGAMIAFLKYHNAVLTVREGDEVKEIYRVEKIDADFIDFTYLPMQLAQRLVLAP